MEEHDGKDDVRLTDVIEEWMRTLFAMSNGFGVACAVERTDRAEVTLSFRDHGGNRVAFQLNIKEK